MLGDSIPRWVGVRAQQRGSTDLELPWSIAWWGVGGLTWSNFRRSVESHVLLCTPPKIILIHLGGNDICSTSTAKICNTIQKEIRYLRAAFENTLIIWIDILDRINWRQPTEQWPRRSINEKRKRINRFGRSWVQSTGPSDALAMTIDLSTPGFYARDGVHLSGTGMDHYMEALKNMLLKHIQ